MLLFATNRYIYKLKGLPYSNFGPIFGGDKDGQNYTRACTLTFVGGAINWISNL